ncbi:hypothetical protein JHK82_043399 [Glycine max]|nr:hypothetical protein JHK82_043399 [Glycine max]
MPSSSSSSSSSSALTVPNLHLRALRIWSSKYYAIAAFIFLVLSLSFFLPLGFTFPLLQPHSVNPPPQRQPNACAYYAWTGAPLVTISEAGSDPDPAIG